MTYQPIHFYRPAMRRDSLCGSSDPYPTTAMFFDQVTCPRCLDIIGIKVPLTEEASQTDYLQEAYKRIYAEWEKQKATAAEWEKRGFKDSDFHRGRISGLHAAISLLEEQIEKRDR